jgi:ATP/maltotriose-dependent transcriptional regulator MalT
MSSKRLPFTRAARPDRPSQHLGAGEAALARGEWRAALDHFDAALREEETPAALEGRGLAAWWLDLADVVFDARERAYRLYKERDDRRAAGRMAVWLAWDSAAFRGESAVANGWFQRAHAALDGQPESPEQAWLANREASAALDAGEIDRARSLASTAIRISRAAGSPDYELMGRAIDGFAQVAAGDVAAGMRQLDDVNAAVVAGEMLDPIAMALTCCSLIHACERVRDYDRASQWCNRLKAFCTQWGLRPLFAVCRTQYASICVWRGIWDEAEQELTAATEEFSASRPGMSAEGLVRLADLRRRQGRLEEAAQMLDRIEAQNPPSLSRAELLFDQGAVRDAADLAARHLRRLASKNRTERAAALELSVRTLAALDDLDGARASLAELNDIANGLGTPPLRASSNVAAGLVAAAGGDLDAARRHLEDAVDLFQECLAPFETARARIDLSGVLAELGQKEAAMDHAQRAITLLEPIHAAPEIARARRVLEHVSRKAPSGPEPASAGLTRREIEVLRLVSDGLSNQAIAERLFISDHTVHRHIANILTKLAVPSRAAAVAAAARLGVLADAREGKREKGEGKRKNV